MPKFYITKQGLDSAKQYRKDFQNFRYHGFRHLSWIKSIKVEHEEDYSIVYIKYKFGITLEYEMARLQVKYLLKDCGIINEED